MNFFLCLDRFEIVAVISVLLMFGTWKSGLLEPDIQSGFSATAARLQGVTL